MERKRQKIGRFGLFAMACLLGMAGLSAESPDPTRPVEAMAEHLTRELAGSDAMRLHALVIGRGNEGVALVGRSPEQAAIVRQGSVLPATVNGVRLDVDIRSVTVRGVELASASGTNGFFLAGTYSPLAAPTNAPTEFIRYLECESVPIGLLMRLVADQAGVNISASDATADKTVSIFLRNVSADAAVEEICRATGLWFRREPNGSVIRITTMKEYNDNLTSFREEATETFTLLYPNVIEVASVIYGLYPDRTLLSLGEEELDEDDENDLSRRFRRFRVLDENGGSTFLEMNTTRASSTSSRTGSGTFSFSRGNAFSRLSQWDQINPRARRRFNSLNNILTTADAKRLESAYQTGATNEFDEVYGLSHPGSANIFVTLSRKNNMLVVRTSDVRVMDEIRSLVKKLDVPTPMVLMEVKVLELDITDDYEAEFSYSFNREKNLTVSGTDANGNQVYPANNVLAGFPGFSPVASEPTIAGAMSFQVVSRNIAARIQLLQKDGKVKTLATPTLLVANNEVSRIFDGHEHPIVKGISGQVVIGERQTVTAPATEFEYQDVGTMLLITPNINSDKTVTLRLLQENSEVQENGGKIPIYTSGSVDPVAQTAVDVVYSRSLTGTFVAKDGMTVMAGGLIRETEKEIYTRTPILGSIPLLGWLFRGTEKGKQRTELIVLIRPHVISTPYEGGRISEELLKALSAHPTADGRPNMGIFKKDDGPAPERNVLDDITNIVK